MTTWSGLGRGSGDNFRLWPSTQSVEALQKGLSSKESQVNERQGYWSVMTTRSLSGRCQQGIKMSERYCKIQRIKPSSLK